MQALKYCKACDSNKELDCFSLCTRSNKKQYRGYCRACESKKAAEWRKNNPIKVKSSKDNQKNKDHKNSYAKQYAEKNKEKISQRNKQRYRDNIAKFKEISKTQKFKDNKRRYRQRRLKSDPIFRVRRNISSAIWRALRKGSSNKAGQSILKYLEYTIDDLKSHIGRQFDNNMNWDNYGIVWHIDHIVPQSDLPYSSMEDDNFKKCWSLNNLRPLDAKQNILDGVNRIRHKKT